ncbi:uncharacterized protein [Argopecten irradians]|uniref:uncharacterized protein n=1 Tax=Argopecten irradians TaxID=31199 RepID=UPI00371CCF12
MDDETIDWVMSDSNIDTVSSVPLSAVAFMLYYGFELKYFFLEISDALMDRYPLTLYDVGRSSVYLGGSCGHGFFLNSRLITELRDFDIVTILKKYDIRTECEYDKSEQTEINNDEEHDVENEHERDYCSRDNRMNVTCGSDTAYLNVEPSSEAGYILLRKCRKHSVSQVSLQQRYVSSAAVMKARFEYWYYAKDFMTQRYEGTSSTPFFWGDSRRGPILSFVDTQGPAVNAFLTDRRAPMTSTLHTDIVIALPYPGWPAQAQEWLSRARKYGWPSLALRQEIQSSIGCMIVPIGQHGSEMEDFQWRVSFSRAEMLLSRSFTRVQRELVHLLKSFEIGGSYHIINLVYRLIEDTPGSRWRSKNLASLMFTLVDEYIACIRKRKLSHYFLPTLNLLAKYQNDFVEVKGRPTPIDEQLDSVLLPLYRLRINPLETLLNRNKHLSLRYGIRRRVFAPLVDEMKSSGSKSKHMYIDTLVSLAKAHFYHNRVSLAYRYIQDAFKFRQRLTTDIDEEKQVDLHLTASVCSYIAGDTASALNSLQELEQFFITDEHNLKRHSYLTSLRSPYFMLYGRILFIRSYLSLSDQPAYFAAAREMYQRAKDTLVPDTAAYLDAINFFMHLGETDEVDTLIVFVSKYLRPDDRCEEIHEGLEIDETQRDIHGGDERLQEQLDIHESLSDITTESGNHVDDNIENGQRSSGTQFTGEALSRDSPNDTPSTDGRIDEAIDNLPGENIEVVYDRDRFVREEMTSFMQTEDGSAQFTTITRNEDDDDDDDDDEDSSTFPEEINNLNSYFIDKVILANQYEKIGMHGKSKGMLEKLKEKLEREHGNADSLFPLVVKASKIFEKEILHVSDPTPEDWKNLFRDNVGYMTYCSTDLPIVDVIIATLIRRKAGGTVKLTHIEALLHFQIQHYKLLHEFSRARSVVSVLKCTCAKSNRKECEWLLELHSAYFGHRASEEDAENHEETRREVVDEVIARIDQLMDVLKAHEIRNTAMDDLFNFSDY